MCFTLLPPASLQKMPNLTHSFTALLMSHRQTSNSRTKRWRKKDIERVSMLPCVEPKSLNNVIGMQWAVVADNAVAEDRVGEIAISSLLCKVVVDDNNAPKSFQIIVSTAQLDDRIATIYNVHTVGVDGRYWTKSSFPVSASLLNQTEPLILGQQGGLREEGLVSIVKDHAVNERLRCIGQRCAPNGGYSSSFEYKAGKLGNLRSAFSHLNIFGFEVDLHHFQEAGR